VPETEHKALWREAPKPAQNRVLGKLRYHIFLCDTGSPLCHCEENGASEVRAELRKRLAFGGLAPFVKTTLMTCNQPGAEGPVAVLYPEGIWYARLRLEDLDEFIEEQLINGRPVERLLLQTPPVMGHQRY
jgi:(2Fe-2S) ferredoxin